VLAPGVGAQVQRRGGQPFDGATHTATLASVAEFE
jgi:hypothetical protein